jgi:hypothetical protein
MEPDRYLRCSPDGGRRLTRPSMASNRGAFPRRPAALLGATDGTRDQEQRQRQASDPGVRRDDAVERNVGWADKPSASLSAPSIAGLASPAYGAALAVALDLGSRIPRRRAGGSARSGAHRMCASFPSVHGCTVGKPRRSDAHPRAARARYPGRLSFGYFSLAKHCAAGAARTPKAAPEGRRAGCPESRKVTRTPKADETGRGAKQSRRIPSSHRRIASMNGATPIRLPMAAESVRAARQSGRVRRSHRGST